MGDQKEAFSMGFRYSAVTKMQNLVSDDKVVTFKPGGE